MKTFFAWILGLGTLAGALMILLSRRNKVATFADAVEVQKLKQAIAQDAAKAKELKGQGDDARIEREQLLRDVAESKRQALAIANDSPTRIYEMSDAEVAKLFTESGL